MAGFYPTFSSLHLSRRGFYDHIRLDHGRSSLPHETRDR